jgi:hypothetical protein
MADSAGAEAAKRLNQKAVVPRESFESNQPPAGSHTISTAEPDVEARDPTMHRNISGPIPPFFWFQTVLAIGNRLVFVHIHYVHPPYTCMRGGHSVWVLLVVA